MDRVAGRDPDARRIPQHRAAHPEEHPNRDLRSRGNTKAQAIDLDSSDDDGDSGSTDSIDDGPRSDSQSSRGDGTFSTKPGNPDPDQQNEDPIPGEHPVLVL